MRFGAIILTIIFWLALILIIIFIDPAILQPIFYLPFWIILWLAITWMVWLIRGKFYKGVVWATAGVLYLILRYFHLGYWFNGLLIAGMALTINWYLSKH